MDEANQLDDEVHRLGAEVDRFRKERDAYRNELDALRSKGEETMSAQLRLLSVSLSKEIREDFYSVLRRAGWLLVIVATVATAGGLWTLSDLIRQGINTAVEKRSQDISKLRENVIQAVVDFRFEAKNALQDIQATKTHVKEEGQQAGIEIRSRVSSVGADAAIVEAPVQLVAGVLPESLVVTIPVVVHIVYPTEAGNISDAQIKSQIEVLNQDYRAKNPDIAKVPKPFKELIGDARIQFALAAVDPLGKPTSGITRTRTTRSTFGSDDSVKLRAKGGTDAWPTKKYLNIWVTTLENGLLGYSQLPGGPAGVDGIVVHNIAFGTSGTATAPFNKGRTTTSQIGRYLNLRHIWGDASNCTGDDFVADTPVQASPNYGRPVFPHISCNNGPNGDMFMTFADYVDDDAMYMFTKGQVARMRETLAGPRSELWKR